MLEIFSKTSQEGEADSSRMSFIYILLNAVAQMFCLLESLNNMKEDNQSCRCLL